MPELSLETVVSPPEYLNSINETQAFSLCSLSWQPWLSKSLLLADGAKSYLPLARGHHLLLRQPQWTSVQLWEVKCVCTQAALIPIVYTDESWGPKVFSFTVCKGPKEWHAVEINYINSGAGSTQVKACSASLDNPATDVIGNGGEKNVACPNRMKWAASFWPQVIVMVIKQTQTRKTSITPIHHQNERFGIAPRHWDVQKIIQFKHGGVIFSFE